MPIIKPGPYDTDERDLENNFDALKEHVEDRDFKTWLPARVFQTDLDVGASSAEGGYVSAPYWEFADAKISVVSTTLYRADYWRVGYLALSLYYTGDTGSTNTIVWQTRISGFLEDGTAFTTAAGDVTILSSTFGPGPATANELKIVDVAQSGWLPWTARYPLISVMISRLGGNASDTYAGEARFLGALLRFYWTRR